MENFFCTVMLLILPMLIGQKQDSHHGLNLGLWISLFFWGAIHYSLSLVVFSAALIYFFYHVKESFPNTTTPYVKKPSLTSFMLFLIVMTIFCAWGDVCAKYGIYIQLEQDILTLSNQTGFFGLLTGPVFFGLLNDKKGPFPATITLTLIAAASVGLTASSYDVPFFFPLGIFFLYLSIAGAFTLMPLLTTAFFGKQQLVYTYPTVLFTLSFVWGLSRYIFLENWSAAQEPGNFLISLIFLALLSAIFSFSAWKHRLVLVK